MTIGRTTTPSVDQGITGGTTTVFSMKQAAEVAGISVSTLRRRRSDLVAAGAEISPEGWKVPMTALVACGLIPGEGPEPIARAVPTPSRSSEGPQATDQARQLDELTSQVRDLEREVAEWRRRAEVAEARAAERGRALDALRIANETERMALRMLTAGTSPPAQHQEPAPPAEAVVLAAAPQPNAGQPSAPVARHPSLAPREPRRKGFFSRVMGL